MSYYIERTLMGKVQHENGSLFSNERSFTFRYTMIMSIFIVLTQQKRLFRRGYSISGLFSRFNSHQISISIEQPFKPPNFSKHELEKLLDGWGAIINKGGECVLNQFICIDRKKKLNLIKTPRSYAST